MNICNISIYDIILDVIAGVTEKYFINICYGLIYVALTGYVVNKWTVILLC